MVCVCVCTRQVHAATCKKSLLARHRHAGTQAHTNLLRRKLRQSLSTDRPFCALPAVLQRRRVQKTSWRARFHAGGSLEDCCLRCTGDTGLAEEWPSPKPSQWTGHAASTRQPAPLKGKQSYSWQSRVRRRQPQKTLPRASNMTAHCRP